MNKHLKRFLRLTTLISWAITLGIIYSVSQSIFNFMALGWITLLLYFTGTVVTIYVVIVFTRYIWSLK